MRNPRQLYDVDIPKQEPLLSLFRKQVDWTTKNPEDIDGCARELIKNHLDAVKAWLEHSFPAKNAPTGKMMSADYASALLFIQFHWILRTEGQHKARRFLDKERIARKWPIRTISPAQNQGSKATSDGKNAAEEVQARPGSKSTNPAPSHVMVSSISNHNIHTKSDTSTVRCTNTHGPKYKGLYFKRNNTNNYPLPTSSANMETSTTVPQKRPSSPLNQHIHKRRSTSKPKQNSSTATLSPTSNAKSKIPSELPSSKRLRSSSDVDDNRSKILAGIQADSVRVQRALPSSSPTRKLRPPKVMEDSGRESYQVTESNISKVGEYGNKNPKNGPLTLPGQQTKDTGAVANSVPVDNSKSVDFKEETLDEAPMTAKQGRSIAIGNTATPKKVKTAKLHSNTNSTLDQGPKTRKFPRIKKTASESLNTNASISLASGQTQHLRSKKSAVTVPSSKAQNIIGSPATNLRSRRNLESDSRASDTSRPLKRKRNQSLETNAKQVRMRLNSSSLTSGSKGHALIKSEPAAGATGKTSSTRDRKAANVLNDTLILESAKGFRTKADSTNERLATSAETPMKALSNTKQARTHSSKKISEREAESVVNQQFKSEDVGPSLDDSVIVVKPTKVRKDASTSKARKSNAALPSRRSRPLKHSDPDLGPSLSLTIQTDKKDDTSLQVGILPATEETGQPPVELPNSATSQGDIVTNLFQQAASDVDSEQTVAEDPGIVPEPSIPIVKSIATKVITPESVSSSAYHANQHVETLKEEPPENSSISPPLKHTSVSLREDTEDDENVSMPLDDDTNLPAGLTHLEAEDVVEEADEPIDTLYRFPKAPLRFLPPLWSESRQEICESFDWFRSYQGGVYHAHNVAKGYLLGGFPARRDTFEHGGRLIISHGGGKAESLHAKQGQLSSQPATDQLAQDKSVRALWNNYQNNRPLVLLMDERYALFPYDLKAKNIAYAVLGFYTISDAWAEYQPSNNERGRVVRYKFAFRWCDQQGTPWWLKEANKECSPYVTNVTNDSTETVCTPTCNIEDYTDSGPTTAVASECSSSPSPDTAINSEDISREADTKDDIIELNKSFVGTKERTTQTCLSCSRNFPQIYELCWTCLNPDCYKFFTRPNGQILPDNLEYSRNFLELAPSMAIPVGFGTLMPAPVLSLNVKNKTTYAFTRGFHCNECGRLSCRYQWERWECRNCEIKVPSTSAIREAATLIYQTPPLNFKDYILNPISEIIQLLPRSFRHDKGRGIVHTFVLPHYSAKIHHIQPGNVLGREEADSIFLDYQIQANSGDLKFRRWPMRAHKCRGSLLTNYFSQNSGAPYKYVGGDAHTVPFEAAPGAVVRARAFMQKRIMQALNIPAQFNEVLSAAYMERQKMAFHSDNEKGLGPLVAGLSLGSPASMHFRLLAKHDPEREKRGILLSIVLRHGDILVMDGAAVQHYYEHTVVPTNFRIAATARQINADHA